MAVVTVPRFTRRQFALLPFGIAAVARAQTKPTRWALLSDTHIGAQEVHRGFRLHDQLRTIISQVLEWKPDGAVISGDLARTSGLAADYAAFRRFVDPLTNAMPVAMALGNHDDRKNFLAEFSTHQGAQPLKNKHVVVVEHAPVRLIALDSLMNVNQTPGFLGRGQRDWLAKFLSAGPAVPTLLFVHHTLEDSDGSLLDFDRLLSLVRPHRSVKAIVYGHSHKYGYTEDNGVHLINVPSTGYSFEESSPVGWVSAAFTTEGGDFTLHAVAGNKTADGQTKSLRWRT
jgi:3',5'-cyclic AMP phosphodiesterase CpdA